MIAWLEGVLLVKQAPNLVLNVNGVGYELEAPMSTFYELPAVNEKVSLYVHMVVREDAQLLFGFSSQQQRDLFRSVIKVNGVGPKVALAILSTFSAQELRHCMLNDDVKQLTTVPGIGAKTAQRLLVEMKDRLEKEFSDVALESDSGDTQTLLSQKQDAIDALNALGYKNAEVMRAVGGLANDLSSEEMIRQSLKTLSGRVL